MRWEGLFADLEAQAEAAQAADLAAEVAERTRGERARILLADRLRAALGAQVMLSAVQPLEGQLRAVGPDWLLLAERSSLTTVGVEVLLPLSGLLWLQGIPLASAAPTGGVVARRLDLRSALGGLVRDRAPLDVVLRDGSELHGILDRVGADYVELATLAPGEERRRSAVRAVRLLPLDALGLLRRR